MNIKIWLFLFFFSVFDKVRHRLTGILPLRHVIFLLHFWWYRLLKLWTLHCLFGTLEAPFIFYHICHILRATHSFFTYSILLCRHLITFIIIDVKTALFYILRNNFFESWVGVEQESFVQVIRRVVACECAIQIVDKLVVLFVLTITWLILLISICVLYKTWWRFSTLDHGCEKAIV